MFLRIWSNQYTVISRFAFNNPSHLLHQHRLVGGFCTATENTTPEKEYTFFNNLTSQKIESMIESGEAADLEILDRSLLLAK